MGTGNWETVLRPLKDEDLRGIRDPALVKMGPGRKGNDEEDLEEEEEEFQRLLSSKPKRWGDGGATVSFSASTSSTQSPGERPAFYIPPDLIHPDRMAAEHRTVHGTGETRKSNSWIWWAGGSLNLDDGADENGNEILRSEWCKSRSRQLRAREEILLVVEEMRRTLEYLEWRAKEWESHIHSQKEPTSALEEGRRAFVVAQAAIQRDLKAKFQKMFDDIKGPCAEVEEDQEDREEDGDEEDAPEHQDWSEEEEDMGHEGVI
ncbi:hypothetical protein VNI00_018133 [Paramarasmius palmivorus]|uniref:Uncharacterized protein n=1 Tax=Paramarasmius palmivorus TaxID=297713 RepID=A0AAW0B077_9AGAR